MSDKWKKRFKGGLVNFLIFLSVYYAVHLYQTRLSPVGSAPEISGWLIQGGKFEGLLAADKPILVHFWATWCKVCKLEESSINNIAEDHNVITIASQSGSFSKVKQFVDEHELRFPVIVDQNGFYSKQWGVVGFPSTYIIDENNQIRFVEAGFTSELGLRFRLWLARNF